MHVINSAGELSSADLPPESGGSGQQEQYDLSIDVFPRLHEKDPYRYGAMACCDWYTLQASHDRHFTTPCCCSRLGLSREASFEEVQDARNYLYEVCPTSGSTLSLSHPEAIQGAPLFLTGGTGYC